MSLRSGGFQGSRTNSPKLPIDCATAPTPGCSLSSSNKRIRLPVKIQHLTLGIHLHSHTTDKTRQNVQSNCFLLELLPFLLSTCYPFLLVDRPREGPTGSWVFSGPTPPINPNARFQPIGFDWPIMADSSNGFRSTSGTDMGLRHVCLCTLYDLSCCTETRHVCHQVGTEVSANAFSSALCSVRKFARVYGEMVLDLKKNWQKGSTYSLYTGGLYGRQRACRLPPSPITRAELTCQTSERTRTHAPVRITKTMWGG